MGWKASMLIVNQPTPVDHQKLLQHLGFANLVRINDEPLEVAIFPDDGQVYIGNYKGNLVICARAISNDFIETPNTETKHAIATAFPSSEICAIVLHSVINLWGFVVLKSGKTLRARAGSAEDGTFLDVGTPLDEEKELLSKSTIGRDGKRTYVLSEEYGNEAYAEDQIGEEFVFKICKRYFGHELDHTDDEFSEIKLTGYSFGNSYVNKTAEKVAGKRKWKKSTLLLLALLLYLIWKIYRY